MPTLQQLEASNFDHYAYASGVVNLIGSTFPDLEHVAFEALREDGTPARYADLPLPAFLLSFGDPDFEDTRPMQPMEDTAEDTLVARTLGEHSGAFMNLRIRVQGLLMLPAIPAMNARLAADVGNLEVYQAEATALILAVLRMRIPADLKTLDTVIESVEQQVDVVNDSEIYRVTEFIFSHEIIVGLQGESVSFTPKQLFIGLTFPAGEQPQADILTQKAPIAEWEDAKDS